MKAVFLDFATVGPSDLDTSSLTNILPDIEIRKVTAVDEVVERIADADIVLTNKVRLSREVLQYADRLKLIGLTATGTDNVDLDFASAQGIAVCNIRAYCTDSVVEHVFAVLLKISHSIDQYEASVRAGNWEKSEEFCLLDHPLRELSAMTLGIVGYGELGRGVARMAKNFGMRILVASSYAPDSNGEAARVSFDELLRQCDVISLHCPLTASTRNMFGAAQFAAMKSNAILINTARGGLIDSEALATALANGDIYAAAIDVLPQEPPVDGDPLLEYRGNNLVLTPHIAWATREARQRAIDELARNVAAFLAGEVRNRII
jgi:glycerate dehydrogenase